MTRKQRAKKLELALERAYPDAVCSLDYDREQAYRLLISVRLAAQCTDARVNIVTGELFREYPTLESIAAATADEIESIIRDRKSVV